MVIWYIFLVSVCCTKKNLATLVQINAFKECERGKRWRINYDSNVPINKKVWLYRRALWSLAFRVTRLGCIFAHWAIIYYRLFSEITHVAHIVGATFFYGISNALIFTAKWVGPNFGRLFHKLIGSPCWHSSTKEYVCTLIHTGHHLATPWPPPGHPLAAWVSLKCNQWIYIHTYFEYISGQGDQMSLWRNA
jgi:hypothetical protein